MSLDSLVAAFNYVTINAAGNIILLMDGGAARPAFSGRYVRRAVEACQGNSRIDIVGFVGQIDGCVHASFWNPDGTPERMCGNACRSIPLALRHWHPAGQVPKVLAVYTELCCVKSSHHPNGSASVEIPIAAITVSRFQQAREQLLVDVGTPHLVRRAGELFSEEVNGSGEQLSTAPAPVNATFCKVMPTKILARTFERGVGETKSCGTGAIAAVLALERWGAIHHLPRERIVHFSSGHALTVARTADNRAVSVTGECRIISDGIFVFDGKSNAALAGDSER